MNPLKKSSLTLVLALALAVSACGSETATVEPGVAALPTDSADSAESLESNSDSGDRQPTETEIEKAELQFQQCLEDNGISTGGLFGETDGEAIIEGGETSDGAGIVQEFETDDFEATEAAFAECDEILDGVFGEYNPSPEEEARMQDAQAVFESCMAANGIKLDTSDAGGGIAFSLDEDPESSGLDQIMDDCSTEAFGDLDDVLGSEDDDS